MTRRTLLVAGTTLLLSRTLASPTPSSQSTSTAGNGAVIDLPIIVRNSYSFVNVPIGSPAKDFSLLFDTGSSTPWVVDTTCGTACRQPTVEYERTTYSMNESSTARYTGGWGWISYFGGYTSGATVQDTWALPDTQGGNVEWTQAFLSVTSSTMTYFPGDGFLGLAFSSISEGGANTMVETLLWGDKLKESRFAVYYGTNIAEEWVTNKGPSYPGFLTIGGSKEAEVVEGGEDGMKWVELEKSNGEYEVWRTGVFSVAGKANGVENKTQESGAWMVFDTGSGRSSVPPDVVESLYESIGMNYTAIFYGHHIPLCEEFNSSWSVAFELGVEGEKVEVEIPGNLFRNPGFAHRADACWPPFDSGDVDGFYMFGDDLLQKIYSVWEFGGKKVGTYRPKVGLGLLKEELLPEFLKE